MLEPDEAEAPDAEGVSENAEAVEKTDAPEEAVAPLVWLALDAESDEVIEALPVGEAPAISLAWTVEAEVNKLDEDDATGKMAWMRISWHCAPIHSS